MSGGDYPATLLLQDGGVSRCHPRPRPWANGAATPAQHPSWGRGRQARTSCGPLRPGRNARPTLARLSPGSARTCLAGRARESCQQLSFSDHSRTSRSQVTFHPCVRVSKLTRRRGDWPKTTRLGTNEASSDSQVHALNRIY